MLRMATSKHSPAGKQGDNPQPSESNRRLPSFLGLSIVSALNVVCLAFLVLHFIAHQNQASRIPVDFTIAGIDGLDAISLHPLTRSATAANQNHASELNYATGNIELVPTSKLVIGIATGMQEPVGREDNDFVEVVETVTSVPLVATRSNEYAGHWVQLGALSKKATATYYWSSLKNRHAILLQGQTPRYFGPSDVGGNLYHIRLGPMVKDVAKGLCDRLRTDGADCFCVRSPNDSTRNHSPGPGLSGPVALRQSTGALYRGLNAQHG